MGEIFDIYNSRRKKINLTHERGVKLPIGAYRLVVHVWIIDNNGDVVIQRRIKNKSYGGMWDCSAGGCATTGHNTVITAVREVEEEIGLNIEEKEIEKILTLKCSDVLDDIYIVRKKIDLKDITIQKEEVMDVKIISIDEIDDMVKDGVFIKYKYLNKLKEILKEGVKFKNIYNEENVIKEIDVVVKEKNVGKVKIDNNFTNSIVIDIEEVERLDLKVIKSIIDRIELMHPEFETWKIKKNIKIVKQLSEVGYIEKENYLEKKCELNRIKCLRE